MNLDSQKYMLLKQALKNSPTLMCIQTKDGLYFYAKKGARFIEAATYALSISKRYVFVRSFFVFNNVEIELNNCKSIKDVHAKYEELNKAKNTNTVE